jgi:6-phosphofructokinase 1
MATILREDGPIYSAKYDKVPLEKVAAADRSFPAQWIAKNGYDVTDDFVRYAMPLVGEDMVSLPMIGGRQRMARLEMKFADKKLKAYVPQADR